ncbi:MAG: ABC transporter substrate-binding protein [Candidatus Nezhaarchaeales archaeon]
MSKRRGVTKLQIAVIVVVIVVVAAVGAYLAMQPTAPGPGPLPAKDNVVIGWAHGKSGYLAPQTATLHPYFYWVIEEYNNKGGIYVPEYGKKLPIRYIEYDDESSIDKCLTLYEKLITEDKVDLIFEPTSTAFVYAVFAMAEKYKYPLIGLTFGSEIAAQKMRTGEFKYAFSVLGFPSEAAKEVADFFDYINSKYGKNEIKKVGIIHHNDQHGVEYASAMFSELSIRGYDVPVYQSYPMTIADFTPLIKALRDANVDVVILCGYEGATFLWQCIAQDYNPKFIITGPGSMEVPFLVFGPFGFNAEQVKGIMNYDGWPATSYNTPELQAWVDEHKRRLGWEPFPAAATFYSALQSILQAVERHGLDRTKIRDALATETYDTLLGKFKFRQGYSAQAELAGTLIQWTGKDMMEVVWPKGSPAATSEPIYPKPPWPK